MVKRKTVNGTIEISRRSEMSAPFRDQIDQATIEEFGHIPVIRETVWASADWHTAFMSDGEVLSFLSIIERQASFDGGMVKIAGIGNVITRNPHRHKGLGTLIMQKTQQMMSTCLQTDFGLLLCSDDVIPFYSRLGWRKTCARLTFDQPTGARVWPKDVLIYSPRGNSCTCKNIDLRGLPW
jgi:predicted GNAT family N-acyltransferase